MNTPVARPRIATPWQDKALEIIMRDSLGGLEELANLSAYANGCSGFEILSVEAPGSEPTSPATLIPFPGRHRGD